MSKTYFKIIPAVYLVLRDNDSILLSKRANTGYQDGMYSLAAGHLDGDETLETALCREASEELSIVIKPADLHLVHIQHRRATEENLANERVDFYFECTRWKGAISNHEPNKCSELLWKNITSLPENIINHVDIAVRAIEAGQFNTDYGW